MQTITFPEYSNTRCLMMPFIQGAPSSVPRDYNHYRDIIETVFIQKGELGFLTIDESPVTAGTPHRGDRARHGRALHTEAGRDPSMPNYSWGGGKWGSSPKVTLNRDVRILLANNLDDSAAIWKAVHEDTSLDGDIGDRSTDYPYSEAVMLKAGEVHEIGILTPHESLPVAATFNRQFLRIISSGVYGREDHFTVNPLIQHA